jgi:predicted nucleotidyltransferase
MEAIEAAKSFSEGKLGELRTALSTELRSSELVVTCGSYARREASSSSDMDYYVILDDGCSELVSAAADEATKRAVKRIVGKLPSSEGAFATNIYKKELLENYGGSRDSNETITRRMLYLLEGEYLTQAAEFKKIRSKILEKYISNTPGDHQIAFYLLNDIIRYWRTLAVDYADKTHGAIKPKPWAVRNIKLIFSRKLIYASGLFSVALTADRSQSDKIEILEYLFSMTPIDRIKYVCGASLSDRLFEMYSFFLNEIGENSVREHLNSLTREASKSDKIFRKLKNEGHYFSRELMGLFSKTFHPSHPIHMAVIF